MSAVKPLSPALERFVTHPFPYSEPPKCMECEGHGYTCEARDWQEDKCEACNGTGYELEEEGHGN